MRDPTLRRHFPRPSVAVANAYWRQRTLLGAGELSPRAVVRMRVGPEMVNGHAIAHGGLVFALADTAFACACNSYGPVTVAAGADVTFLRPARAGDLLEARAAERSASGRSGIYDVTVTRGGDVIAEFRGRSRAVRA